MGGKIGKTIRHILQLATLYTDYEPNVEGPLFPCLLSGGSAFREPVGGSACTGLFWVFFAALAVQFVQSLFLREH